jgi:hypothetical protein
MKVPGESGASGELATGTATASELDTVDTCRMRLLALRTRIETNWPTPSRRLFARGQEMDRDTRSTIAELLHGLPTPLPLHAGTEPESIVRDMDVDLRLVPGRAVDAGLALLAGSTLDTPYPHQVTMLQSHKPVARGSIVVSEPTVGLIVATIIGTLDAVSEVLRPPAPPVAAREPAPARRADAGLTGSEGKPATQRQPDRARRVPRI